MNKNDVQGLINLIDTISLDEKGVETVMQKAVDAYWDAKLKDKDKDLPLARFRSELDNKADKLAHKFKQAVRNKIKADDNKKIRVDSAPQKPIKQTTIKEVAIILGVTTQNINHLLRKHKHIKVYGNSARKRYLDDEGIEQLKKIGNHT